jgi:hypothetical protein
MATLNEQDRAEVAGNFMRELSNGREALATSKANLRAALDAIDNFFDANAANINAAIPQPARAELTTAQKARLTMFVIRQRYVAGA